MEDFLMPKMHERILHTRFVERGLSLPLHPFLRGLLFFYGLQLHNLNPNGILHISCFITFRDCFLGISPYFAMWKSLFLVKPQPTQERPSVCGGTWIQLQPKLKYFELKMKKSNKMWYKFLVYCAYVHRVCRSMTMLHQYPDPPGMRRRLSTRRSS